MESIYSESASSVNQSQTRRQLCSNSKSANQSNSGSRGETRITSPLRVVNNPDKLKVSVWLDWSSDLFFQELENLKLYAQSTGTQEVPYHAPGNFDWNLKRTGANGYSYYLKSGDLFLMFNHGKAESNSPNCRIEIGSLSCWSPGYYKALQLLLEHIRIQGGSLKKLCVSEIHLAADLVGLDISNLLIEKKNYWIKKANKFSTYFDRNHFSGISIGKGNFMLRIYDKVLELEKSSNKQLIFAEAWGVASFNDIPVTRVEFQLRRETLKQFGESVNTINGLVDSLQSIWNYSCNDWARHCNAPVDSKNKNQSKAQLSNFWKQVTQVQWTGTTTLTRNTIPTNKNRNVLFDVFLGCAMTLAAFEKPNPEDIDHIIAISCNHIEEKFTEQYKEDSTRFIQKMKKKHNEIFSSI